MSAETPFGRRNLLALAGLLCPTCNSWAFPRDHPDQLLGPGTQYLPPGPAQTSFAGCGIVAGDTKDILDRRVGRDRLGDLSAIWDLVTVVEREALQAFMGVKADIGFYEDDSPNARAIKPVKPSEEDGTILVGLQLCRRVIGFRGHSAIVGILAHEAAHLLQFRKHDFWDRIATLADPRLEILHAELHADYMSGWYCNQKTHHGALGLNYWDYDAVLHELGSAMYMLADFHGTPDQRTDAMSAGDTSGDHGRQINVWTAYEAGKRYVAPIR